MKSTHISHARDILALLTTGTAYWFTIYPRARRELRHWKRYAHTIPNSTLRAQALQKLTEEHLNPEAAAFFAVLGPRRYRARLVRLMVAYQIMYDYLDAINEQAGSAPLKNGLQLHSALTHAVSHRQCSTDYYRHHPQRDDGGYLDTLIRTCREILQTLPSTSAISPLLVHAADRCGEAQSRNHAVLTEGETQLADWSEAQAPASRYLWWELAAAGISCLSLHALFAAAAVSKTTHEEAEHIDMAYFPPVCAISALLDSLIDYPHDDGTTNHSFTSHYSSSALAARRFVEIITEADDLMRRLPHRRRHKIILAGIASFYLSAPEAMTEFAEPVTECVIGFLGRITAPILAVMRSRRQA
jgi:tetraprenyl-beta-curcumene synthase